MSLSTSSHDLIVSRFGGDASASSEDVKRAADIIISNPSRRFIIISAPGSTPHDVGMTDLLYLCHSSYSSKENYGAILEKIHERYSEIVSGLGISIDVDAETEALKKSLLMGMNLDYIGSRGEYIMARIFAEYLGWKFVDATELICFKQDGTPDVEKTFSTAGRKLKDIPHAVIPSFYGLLPDGKIKTFIRGDCDSAGALIACSVKADMFEKWSDSAKIYSADPSVIASPQLIQNITYKEALELTYVGMNIVTDNVVVMLDKAGIPMKISSIKTPDDKGMLISPELPDDAQRRVAACIAGHKNFTVIHLHKYGLNKDYSFNEKLFGLFARHRIACQHYLSGIHQMSVILKTPMFDIRRNEIINEIQKAVNPDSVTVEKGLSLIAVIGDEMGTSKGIFSVIFDALAEAFIKVKMVEQGADKQNIIFGVSDGDYDNAIKALYNALILS